jgi:hypothetical protein
MVDAGTEYAYRHLSRSRLHRTTPMPPMLTEVSTSSRKATVLKSAVSWLSLVAATTAGLGPSAMVRARVRANIADDDNSLRLVVHSYLPDQLKEGLIPSSVEKPVASAQRAVTSEELKRGVVVEMRQRTNVRQSVQRPVVIAWVERGKPNLAFDACLARPLPGMPQGSAKTRGSSVDLSADVRLSSG